jgi:hypothetical protein
MIVRTLSGAEFTEHEKLYRRRVYITTAHQRYKQMCIEGKIKHTTSEKIERALEFKMEKDKIDAELKKIDMGAA